MTIRMYRLQGADTPRCVAKAGEDTQQPLFDQSGKVFDLVLPLDQVAEGYRAMDERRAIKTLLIP